MTTLRPKVQLSKQDLKRIAQNSLSRVFDTALRIIRSSDHQDAIMSEDDIEELRQIACTLWDATRNEDFVQQELLVTHEINDEGHHRLCYGVTKSSWFSYQAIAKITVGEETWMATTDYYESAFPTGKPFQVYCPQVND